MAKSEKNGMSHRHVGEGPMAGAWGGAMGGWPWRPRIGGGRYALCMLTMTMVCVLGVSVAGVSAMASAEPPAAGSQPAAAASGGASAAGATPEAGTPAGGPPGGGQAGGAPAMLQPVAAHPIEVVIDPSVAKGPVSGRLIVYLLSASNRAVAGRAPADGPFYQAPQPMYAIDLKDAQPGTVIPVDDSFVSFPRPIGTLAPEMYFVQAVLDRNRLDSRWEREPGNLFSEVAMWHLRPTEDADGTPLKVEPTPPVRVTVSRSVPPLDPPTMERVEIVEVPSKLLSAFHGRDVTLKAGVVLPIGYDPAAERRYAALYEIPGFSGDHMMAFGSARMMTAQAPESAIGTLARNSFFIVPSPESGNGHTLFADSATNGPWGRALTEELIPALEEKYKLERTPAARVVRGHSSGGWSALWLGLNYPGTFGAVWSTAPDPVDFRRFQAVDIYAEPSMYFGVTGDFPSYRDVHGVTRMTIRQENAIEELMGPGNSSAQQWDSWQAVFGPKAGDGTPRPLYDAATGAIDREVVAHYEAYDIGAQLRARMGEWGPIFKQRVRLIVGDQDNYNLHEAVALVKQDVDAASFLHLPEGGHGYIKVVPGFDHSSIFASDELRAVPTQIVEHLKRHGMIP